MKRKGTRVSRWLCTDGIVQRYIETEGWTDEREGEGVELLISEFIHLFYAPLKKRNSHTLAGRESRK